MVSLVTAQLQECVRRTLGVRTDALKLWLCFILYCNAGVLKAAYAFKPALNTKHSEQTERARNKITLNIFNTNIGADCNAIKSQKTIQQ